VSDRSIEQITTDDRLDDLESWRDDMEAKFKAAFPLGDHEGHRRAHEVMMEELHERRRLRQAVVEKSVAGLVWAIMVALGIAVWQYIKREIKL
jgi:hypothetical protein